MKVNVDERLRALESECISNDGVQWAPAYSYPELDRAALYGLCGEIVNAIAPNTEAAPVAMLLSLLVAFGNAAGPQARAIVGDDEHPARLYVALVGPTATGAKGTSLAAVRPFLRAADDEWFSRARINGFASGEAVVAGLGGYLRPDDDEASLEKRAFVVEPEFARLLTVNARDHSTASPILRGAWDDGRLQLVRSKQNLLAENAHLSMLAHATPDELRAKLAATDISGGFANRVLFACVKRARTLPSPKPLDPAFVAQFGQRLNTALRFARERRTLYRSDNAETIWAEFYNAEPERDGIVGEITARSAAQRLRLSVAYALLDTSAEILPEHVLAAEAVWRYCAASVEHLFGDKRGDAVQDRLLGELRARYPQGLDRSEQMAVFGRNIPSERLRIAREALATRRFIREENKSTGGRDRIVAYAVTLRTNEERRTKLPDALFLRQNSYVRTAEVGTVGTVGTA